MCGIIAYKGKKDASTVVFEGLKDLEYRGYDSWGIATVADSEVRVIKKVGKISDSGNVGLVRSNLAIAHTRWATHGGVTEGNAHPHLDCSGKTAVVHNGIIENYQELKRQLSGHKFSSETDTEIIPHLIEERMKGGISFEVAVKEVANLLRGRSAFVAVSADSKKLLAVRKGTPLIVGVGNNEFFIASDITAFLKHTRRVQYLDDGELAVIDSATTFFNIGSGEKIDKRIIEIDWQQETAEKQGYEHYLIKEIMEQKETLWGAINQDEAKMLAFANDINNAYGTFLIGCGSAGKVCMTGEYLFSKVAKKHVNSYVCS